jgi:ribosomal protein S24E
VPRDSPDVRIRPGFVLTDEPMLSIDNINNLAFLIGEGFWKWRLFDFDKNNQQQISNDLIAKVIQSIALKADKSLFKVKSIKQKFDEGENIVFDAQIYNQSYELQNNEDIDLTIKNAQGKQFDFTFSKTKSYVLFYFRRNQIFIFCFNFIFSCVIE